MVTTAIDSDRESISGCYWSHRRPIREGSLKGSDTTTVCAMLADLNLVLPEPKEQIGVWRTSSIDAT